MSGFVTASSVNVVAGELVKSMDEDVDEVMTKRAAFPSRNREGKTGLFFYAQEESRPENLEIKRMYLSTNEHDRDYQIFSFRRRRSTYQNKFVVKARRENRRFSVVVMSS